MARRKRNPSPLAIGVGLALAAGAGYFVYQEMKKPAGKTKGGNGGGVSPLSGYYTPGSTLSNSPLVMGKIIQPVLLSFEPNVRNPQTGEIVPAGTRDITLATPGLLGQLVTNLTPQATQDAYLYMERLILTDGVDMQDPTQRDKAVKKTLQNTGARRVDWSKGLAPYTYGSAEFEVWQGVQLLGELAFGTFINKTTMG